MNYHLLEESNQKTDPIMLLAAAAAMIDGDKGTSYYQRLHTQPGKKVKKEKLIFMLNPVSATIKRKSFSTVHKEKRQYKKSNKEQVTDIIIISYALTPKLVKNRMEHNLRVHTHFQANTCPW